MYILKGDVILKADGRNITADSDFFDYAINKKNVGDTLALTVLRDNQIKEINLTLGIRPNFLTYQNADYRIKIQYPFDWTKSEENLSPHMVVIFFSHEQILNTLLAKAVARFYITVEYTASNTTFPGCSSARK
jgi:hypothetical protein